MKEQNGMKRRLVEGMKLPEETIMDLPTVRMVSNSEAVIENHKGITEFTNDILKVKTAAGIIKISGRFLQIGEIDHDIILVRGQIYSLEYV